MERFVAFLTEEYKGAFPLWLAPQQVEIIPVNLDLHYDYARALKDEMKSHGIRVNIDDRNEKMGYKIREAQMRKVPYQVCSILRVDKNGQEEAPASHPQASNVAATGFVQWRAHNVPALFVRLQNLWRCQR